MVYFIIKTNIMSRRFDIVKKKLIYLLMFVIFSSVSFTTSIVSADNESNKSTETPSQNYEIAGVETFTYEFSNRFYIPFTIYRTQGSSIRVELTSHSMGDDPFAVRLEYCSGFTGSCNFEGVRAVNVNRNGADSAYFPDLEEGRYRVYLDVITSDSSLISGYGKISW